MNVCITPPQSLPNDIHPMAINIVLPIGYQIVYFTIQHQVYQLLHTSSHLFVQ